MRDYEKEPLKRGELPDINDVIYAYIELNLSLQKAADFLKVSSKKIRLVLNKNNIIKSKELIQEQLKRDSLDKWGVDNPNKSDLIKDKYRKTCLSRYNQSSPMKLDEIKNKVRNTYDKNWRSENKKKELIDKRRQTYSKNHNGYEHHMQDPDFRNKFFKRNEEKFGSKSPFGNLDIRNKIKEINLEKHGYENPFESEDVRQAIKLNYVNKYGVDDQSKIHINKDSLFILDNKNELIDYINKLDHKPTITELSDLLDVSPGNIYNKIKLYSLNNLIQECCNVSSYKYEINNLFKYKFEKNRNILNGKEIDFYNDDLKLGIEFNGNYWHSFNKIPQIKYHQNKSLLAEESNVFIYHIFEYEWTNEDKKVKIINQLNNLLNLNSRKIFARLCTIREIDYKTCCNFLDINHLQRKDSSKIRLGLFYDDELVSVMTFVKPRFNKNYEWELSRYYCLNNCSVVGGASKLFKFFVSKYEPNNIISYSNIAKSKGSIYKLLNFKLIRITDPNYVWINHKEVLSRYQCQKHKLVNYYDYGNTEDEIMTNRGYFKIYDCGNKVWESSK